MSGDNSSRVTTTLDTIALDQLDNSLGEGRPSVREQRCSSAVRLRVFVRAQRGHRAPEQRLARPSLCVFGALGSLGALGFSALGFSALGFSALGFSALGFGALGFGALGFSALGHLEARSFEARSLAARCYPCDTFIQL
jgi:hypothetical protein